MEDEEGLRAMGERLCARYHANIWWPNFWGLLDAPATAIRGEDMKVRAAVCIVGSVLGIVFVTRGGAGLEVGLDSLAWEWTGWDGDPLISGWERRVWVGYDVSEARVSPRHVKMMIKVMAARRLGGNAVGCTETPTYLELLSDVGLNIGILLHELKLLQGTV